MTNNDGHAVEKENIPVDDVKDLQYLADIVAIAHQKIMKHSLDILKE